uniref:CSP2 n=1 Tax=Corythucha ciliata TaxID=369451 RepID=A0A2S0M1E7_CORCT|nr:chemosensory protein [Corythucha ciliata]AYP30827.1 CSP2 [Corythucha ciliata]
MMGQASFFVLVLLFLGITGQTPSLDEVFDESIDVDDILDNDRILDTYLKCFYGTAKCNTLASAIKERIPDIFSTVCGECTEKQKGIFKHVLVKFIPKRPDDWELILKIYDPKGEYRPKLEEFIKS